MSTSPFRPSKDEPYKYEESFGQPDDDHRIQLPQETDDLFKEEQSFDQVWVWALLGIGTVGVLLPLLLTGQGLWALLLVATIQVLSMSLMAIFRLYTRIDDEGVHYRMKPFQMKFKTIPWKDIDQIYVRKYSPVLEYGGWGIRFGLNGKAFNVSGNKGIQLVLKNGKRILLGTGKPDEASRKIADRPITL